MHYHCYGVVRRISWANKFKTLRNVSEIRLNDKCFVHAKSLQSCPTLWHPMECSSPGPWDSPDKNTGEGCYAILQGIFLTQGSNLHLLCLLHRISAATTKSLQSCPTLCDHIDGSPQAPHPWRSPGKNTGVGCHCLLQCMKVKTESEAIQSCLTLRDPMGWRLPDSSIHGIFWARVLEWVAIGFSNSISTSPQIIYSLIWQWDSKI